jgi:hypothetical protein
MFNFISKWFHLNQSIFCHFFVLLWSCLRSLFSLQDHKDSLWVFSINFMGSSTTFRSYLQFLFIKGKRQKCSFTFGHRVINLLFVVHLITNPFSTNFAEISIMYHFINAWSTFKLLAMFCLFLLITLLFPCWKVSLCIK